MMKVAIWTLFNQVALIEGVQQVFWGDPEFMFNFMMAYGLIGPTAQAGAGAKQLGTNPV